MRLLALVFIFTALSWSAYSEVSTTVSAHDLALSKAVKELRTAGLDTEAKFVDGILKNKEEGVRLRTLLDNFSSYPVSREQLSRLARVFPNDWCSEKQKAYCQLTISYFAVNELDSLAL
jgi:hypothetical protein